MRHVTGILVCLSLLLGACAGPSGPPGAGRDNTSAEAVQAEACRAVFVMLDDAVREANRQDAEAARVAGFPYLKVNRFLASFRDGSLEGDRLEAWIDRLRELDRQARRVEWANLPASDRATLRASLRTLARPAEEPDVAAERCAAVLRRHDMTEEGLAALHRVARVPDSYSTWVRLVGLYPVTSIGVAAGFALWKQAFLPSFAAPADTLLVEGELDVYRPVTVGAQGKAIPARRLAAGQVASIIMASRDNPLAIPEPRGTAFMRLAEAFAPVWQVDRLGTADRIGHPYWRAVDGTARVDLDLARPVAFTRLSHTRFDGEILPQISYTVWFRERPKTSDLDLLGGWLDAVIWRVTIGSDGRPLVWDTIHACGCYHLFFPVPPVERKPMPEDDDLREEALVPGPGPATGPGQRVVVRLSAGAHYVTAVGALGAGGVKGRPLTYELLPAGAVPELALRSAALPAALGGGHRSIYGPDGLVDGTERLERLLLWPMGIASPGATRQWGHHATAFVGRRHFDDVDLFERAFRR